MKAAFISDLHLHDDRPQATRAFFGFLDGASRRAEALYILGDLFEFWIGDDAPLPSYADVITALRGASDRGLSLYFMHGNRDFLIGERFAETTGCRILNDPTTIELHNHEPVLLMHGDTLCTDDVEYQEYRRLVRDPRWQREFLALTPEKRLETARHYRGESMKRTAGKSAAIMDVSQQAVVEAMTRHRVSYLIHGHTHRPGIHDFSIDGNTARRIVLGDWYEQGSVLEWGEGGFELKTLALT